MPLLRPLLICLLLALGLATPVQAARLALVIGNDTYTRVESLRNARADAKAMARALEAAGFRVSLVLDQDQAGMKSALRRFKASLAGGDDAVFFYAGHGVELGGVNYLLPTDIRDESDDQLQDDAIPLQRVLTDLAQQKPKFSLAIIDACRDDPFKGSGRNVGSRGLAPVSAVTGQMIIYSAGAGQKALDRLSEADKSPNGVFTRVFVKAMEREGVPVQELVGTVREEVARLAASVGKEQVPAAYDQVIGKFYFRGSGSTKTSQSAAAIPTPGADGDEQIWQEARRLETVEGYEAYLEAYPKGRYAAMARAAKKKLESAVKVEVPPVARDEYSTGTVFRDCAECPEMVVIPSGSFEMGSPAGKGYYDERPPHRVNVRRFALGKYEVTQGQWRAVMGSIPSSFKECGDDCPVERVSWEDAQSYVKKLNEKVGRGSGGRYRLPSESEWEYGCRGGAAQEEYCGGNSADAVGWYDKNSGGKTHRVGAKQGNGYGLYDMSGNVMEWTQDCHLESYAGAPTDGSAVGTHCDRRAVRGGSWGYEPVFVRSASRYRGTPSVRLDNLGFRVAKTLP